MTSPVYEKRRELKIPRETGSKIYLLDSEPNINEYHGEKLKLTIHLQPPQNFK